MRVDELMIKGQPEAIEDQTFFDPTGTNSRQSGVTGGGFQYFRSTFQSKYLLSQQKVVGGSQFSDLGV